MSLSDFIYFAPFEHTLKEIWNENEALRQILIEKYKFKDTAKPQQLSGGKGIVAPHSNKVIDRQWYDEIESFITNFRHLFTFVRNNKGVDCKNILLDSYFDGKFGKVSQDLALWIFTINYKAKNESFISKANLLFANKANNFKLTGDIIDSKLNNESYQNVYENLLETYYEAFDKLGKIKDYDRFSREQIFLINKRRAKQKIKLVFLVSDIFYEFDNHYVSSMKIDWNEKLVDKHGLLITELLRNVSYKLLDNFNPETNKNVDKLYRLLHFSNNPLKNKFKKYVGKNALTNPTLLEKEMLIQFPKPKPDEIKNANKFEFKTIQEEESIDSDFEMY